MSVEKTQTPGQIIRTARDAKGMSAYALSQAVHCTPQHVYTVEHGRANLSVRLAKAIAKELDLEWTDLIS